MGIDFHSFSQGELIAFAKGMIEADAHFSDKEWAFPEPLRDSLKQATAEYEQLFLAQNLSEGEKEQLVRQKNDHFKNELIPVLRRVIHFIKATADDPENVLNGYGYDPGDFPTAQADILALGENFISGDDQSQGKPWQLTPQLRQQLEAAVDEGRTLYEQCVMAFGNQQEITQTQNEARARLEDVLARCREWLYANVPQGRHDEILEFYGLKPIKEPQRRLYAPRGFEYDPVGKRFVWEKVPAADKYEVQLSEDGGEQWKVIADTPNTEFQISLPNGVVWARIRAYKEDPFDVSSWADVIRIDARVPEAPKNLRWSVAEHEGVEMALLEWDPAERAESYDLDFDPVGRDGDIFELGNVLSTWEPILEFPGIYRYRVRGKNAFGVGPWSNQIEIRVE